MSEGNRYGLTRSVLTDLVGRHFQKGQEFRPCRMENPALDYLQYFNQDCSYYEEPIPGTNFSLLKKSTTGEVIGIEIREVSSYR